MGTRLREPYRKAWLAKILVARQNVPGEQIFQGSKHGEGILHGPENFWSPALASSTLDLTAADREVGRTMSSKLQWFCVVKEVLPVVGKLTLVL